MDIRRWHCYIVINCAVIIPCIVTKTFSLNEFIAAESQRQGLKTSTSNPKVKETAEHFYFNKTLSSIARKAIKLKPKESFITNERKISPLKYKKKFQIKTPLKPKKLKHQNLRYKRKNQPIKKETNNNGTFNQKYIPLLKSLGMLFDNLLISDSRESLGRVTNDKNRQKKNYSNERNEIICTCGPKFDSENAIHKPQKKTITSISSLASKISIDDKNLAPTELPTAYITSTGNFSSFRENKSISILPTRDTYSSWGDDHGFSKGGSATFYRSTERNIPRNKGNSQDNTGRKRNKTSTSNNEENSNSITRNNASNVGIRRGTSGYRDYTDNSTIGNTSKETSNIPKYENALRSITGNINEFKTKNNINIGGNKTEDSKSLPEFSRRLQKFLPKEESITITEHSQENDKHNTLNGKYNNSSIERIIDRSSKLTTKNQRIRSENQTVITIEDFSQPKLDIQNNLKGSSVVTIIDGYSVTRDKNGENKLAEKTIRVHN